VHETGQRYGGPRAKLTGGLLYRTVPHRIRFPRTLRYDTISTHNLSEEPRWPKPAALMTPSALELAETPGPPAPLDEFAAVLRATILRPPGPADAVAAGPAPGPELADHVLVMPGAAARAPCSHRPPSASLDPANHAG